MSRHRQEPPPRVHPRYSRMGAAALATMVTFVALLGGLGLLPNGGARPAYSGDLRPATQHTGTGSGNPAESRPPIRPTPSTNPVSANSVPVESGAGRRVVFDMSDQRVWLVGPDEQVLASYLVSGSVTDNLQPGHYAVYSRSRWAVGVDDSGVMQYFVRFAHGRNAAIGFHSIPTSHGRALQTRAELGTPQSHGCIRQAMPDAKRMWRFATAGTRVVVTA